VEKITVTDFDLAATLNSGQVFHWHPEGAGFAGLIGDLPLYVEQSAQDTLMVSPGQSALARNYFGLDHDLTSIRRTLPKKDSHLRRALKYAPGLRILRQPHWECLASFITSSLKQVAHIRQISLQLRRRFGQRIELPGISSELYAYPSPAALARVGEQALRQCGLGYRAKFLHQSATQISDGRFDLAAVSGMNDEEACLHLCQLPGVGPKIAQCTLLFAYERLGVFPVDVWIERALRTLYFQNAEPEPSAKELVHFARVHFGPYRGYAQQWLFHHARTSGVFKRR
jgi:N-glycosylase/DNA lyase